MLIRSSIDGWHIVESRNKVNLEYFKKIRLLSLIVIKKLGFMKLETWNCNLQVWIKSCCFSERRTMKIVGYNVRDNMKSMEITNCLTKFSPLCECPQAGHIPTLFCHLVFQILSTSFSFRKWKGISFFWICDH